jgi:hypothetical protein
MGPERLFGEQTCVPAGLEFRKRQIYGLLLLALVLLLAGFCRAPLRDIFPPGWWRVW